MDRSFLSVTPIIQSSRRFVCIRTLTYEDAEERDFQRSLYLGRSGDVENTTFCILSPDATKPITRAGRGIGQIFRSPEQMQEWMDNAAAYYEEERTKAGQKPEALSALPRVGNVRLGLNAAAADNLPLVVLFGKTREETAHLEAAAARLAWKPEFIGRCAYASASAAADLSAVDSGAAKPGLLVIQPNQFGLTGKVLARAEATATPEQLAASLRQGLQKFQPRSLFGREYMHAGQAAGAFWETKLPVTDFQEAQARERTRRNSAAPRR
jgi:hypothetical protein